MTIAPRYLTARELQARLSIPRSSFWKYVRERYIPQPVHIAPRCVRWAVTEIEAYERRLLDDRGHGGREPMEHAQ